MKIIDLIIIVVSRDPIYYTPASITKLYGLYTRIIIIIMDYYTRLVTMAFSVLFIFHSYYNNYSLLENLCFYCMHKFIYYIFILLQ